MGFDKAKLTFKALLVVYEASHNAKRGPVKLTLGLRFALAYLYATTGVHVDFFTSFANCLAENKNRPTEQIANYCRHRDAFSFLYLIMEKVGIKHTVDNETKLRNAFERLTGQPPPCAPDSEPRALDH